MRRRLYRLVVVAGWFGDGARRATIGVISVAAWLVSLAPLQETVRAAVGNGDIWIFYSYRRSAAGNLLILLGQVCNLALT
jgi:hypothetical protein